MIAGRLAGAEAAGTQTRAADAGIGRPALVLLGLSIVVGLRWLALVDGRLDGISIGLLFGVGLLGVGLAGRRLAGQAVLAPAPRRSLGIALCVGLAGGLALVGLALVVLLVTSPALAAPGTGVPAVLAGPWLAATVLVALTEELILRGVLFELVERVGRWPLALLVTSATFALIHVPVYGWHVVPLDFGVGLVLGGLRLATGGWLAPGVAHVVADVATWWL